MARWFDIASHTGAQLVSLQRQPLYKHTRHNHTYVTPAGVVQQLENGALLGAAYKEALGLKQGPVAAAASGALVVESTKFQRTILSAAAIVTGGFAMRHQRLGLVLLRWMGERGLRTPGPVGWIMSQYQAASRPRYGLLLTAAVQGSS